MDRIYPRRDRDSGQAVLDTGTGLRVTQSASISCLGKVNYTVIIIQEHKH